MGPKKKSLCGCGMAEPLPKPLSDGIHFSLPDASFTTGDGGEVGESERYTDD